MERSPAGRDIEYLTGDAGTIKRHGRRIERLGRQMRSSADVLEELATGADDQKGQAIDKVREIVGETYTQLRKAGEMYEPTGPILVTYGEALAELKPLIRVKVDDCASSWQTYIAAPGDRHGQVVWSLSATPEELKDAEARAEAEDQAKQGFYDDFVSDARGFDTLYDTWEDAFDTAVDGIGDVFDGGIEDGFWDNVDGYVAGALKVLQVVGIIVAIAGIIIGGPIIALIAAVAGLVTLALTAYQYCRGDTGLTQLILAVVGVIPFGSMGKLFQGSAGRLAFLGDTFSALKPSMWRDAIGQGRNLAMISRFAGGGTSGLFAAGREFLTGNTAGVGDLMSRLLFGKDVSKLEGIIDAMSGGVNGFCNSTTIAAGWEFAYTVTSGSWKLGDRIATWTGNPGKGPSGALPWVGAVL